MRQYRGLTKEGKWVKGYYVVEGYKKPKPHFIVEVGGRWNIVIPETVGQFIGLKDKNKVDIYKDDIVEFNVVNMIWDEEKHEVKEHRLETRRRVVEWETPKFIKHWYPEKMEVIGNIHQHSDLLKEKK